jgi:peptide/nickel transport system ATP-binding protein
MQPLLSITNLSVDFNTENGLVSAIQDVSFSINQGELVAVVGESGSGKSVTSMSVLQLLPPAVTVYRSGAIKWYRPDGSEKELLAAPEKDIQQIRGNEIAMIFQEPMTSLNPVMTCGRQVAEALVQHKKITADEALRQTLGLFEQVQLPQAQTMLKRYPHQLSGGQKQRVMIALAMCCQPQLLICDEPTTALDVTVQKNILQIIKDLQQQNRMGVLFISHDLGLVADIADRIVVMYRGQVVEQGPAKQLLQSPQQNYTRALLACRPALYSKGVRLPVVSDFVGGDETPVLQPQPAVAVKSIAKEKPLIQVRDLVVRYPGKKNFLGKVLDHTYAVNKVSLDIHKGETVGLVGESGCGKTTLGRTLLRLTDPSSGSIQYNGKLISRIHKSQLKQFRKEVQIVFQDPYSSLNPRLTIGDAIAEPMMVHGVGGNRQQRKDAVIQLLEKVQLKPEHFRRYPHEFSGGQRQRIVIARALALGPSFVVCDESVSALDVSVQAQVLNLLNDLKKEFGFTVLFISHDLSVVRYISDRIMVMQKGVIVENGEADAVYHHPQHPYTQKLIDAIPGRSMSA